MTRDKKPSPQQPSLEDVPMSPSLRRLVERCEAKPYPANHVLIKEGDEGNSLFVVLAGRVRAYSTRTEGASSSPKKGSRRITYGEYLPGELLGEMSLDGGKRAATVKTMMPTWCCKITRDDIEKHLSDEPEFAWELFTRLIRRARAATLSLRQIALNDAYGRISHLLQTLATKRVDGARVVSISRQGIASLVGCSRGMVSNIIKELKQGDYIAVDGEDVVLKKDLPPRF